ncbi:hypothetical protein R1flu_004857 [Riccia fluitans]|uniref:Uncharacterized protein n=1 Tax=Riccia fluitans TaxID=41844 RepID=A0ABD1YRH6_9MARC
MSGASAADTRVDSTLKRAFDRSRDRSDGCHYKTLFSSVCSLDKDEAGKPVRICEKAEKLLKRCPGRPEEVVESRTEKTVEDASTSSSGFSLDRDTRGFRGFHRAPWDDKFGPEKGLNREDFIVGEFSDRKGDLSGGPFEELVHAAEDLVRDVFGPFGLAEDLPPRHPGDSKVERPSGWFWESLLGRNPNEKHSRDQSKSQQPEAQKPPDYSDLSRKIQEI